MPHDRKGNLLQVGDKVFIPGKITQIMEGSELHCNCYVEFDEPMPPHNYKQQLGQLNTKQVEKVIEE